MFQSRLQLHRGRGGWNEVFDPDQAGSDVDCKQQDGALSQNRAFTETFEGEAQSSTDQITCISTEKINEKTSCLLQV